MPPQSLYPVLGDLLASVRREADMIPPTRRRELEQLAAWIGARRAAGEVAKLVFICTHNSRRSHFAQVWAGTAAHVLGVEGVETYSGGTEATAFNPRAVAALERAGFRIVVREAGGNPVYEVRFAADAASMACFSKVYDQPPNPTRGFCAIMTCGAADEACPVVFGAAERITIRYDDPKDADGAPHEAATYDERCRQIAREMVFMLSRVDDAG